MAAATNESNKPSATQAPATVASVPAKVSGLPTSATPHTLVNDEGLRLSVHDDVVEKIVGLAVREVKGVHALAPRGAGDRLIRIADRITGADHRDLGVHVEIGTTECAADIYIVADYGADIPKVAAEIRSRVTERVKVMTGLYVRDVNIDVVDLYFADDERATRNLK